ncbi:MAG: SCO6880 family protein, partial [Egicoccus sp.]
RRGWAVAELSTYRFPARPSTGLLFGLSLPRLLALGSAGVVLIVVTSHPSLVAVLLGGASMLVLVAAASVKVAGRALIEWLPVAVGYAWGQATRNNEFYTSPDLADPALPDGVLDLPGGLFGFELHAYTTQSKATSANPTVADYGILIDTFRGRLVAIVEVSGQDLLFCDPDEQQARFAGWGGLLDHVGQSLPELCRLQLVHLCGPAVGGQPRRWHHTHGGRGEEATADSYRQLLDAADGAGQEHRLLLAIALDRKTARRPIRQAGGGRDGAATVLLDRATQVEEALAGAGIEVHGWLAARQVAAVLRGGFDPSAVQQLDARGTDVTTGAGCDPAVAGPAAMVESWSSLRLEAGWATTLQVAAPPSRPVTGEFLQHLLIGVPAARRMSLLYVPTPAQTAERRAQTQQVTAESEQALRMRWGFAGSARHRRSHGDAAQREADLVDGRAVFRLVWTITITGESPAELDAAVGQVEAAARRCALELRRLVGTQRQAFPFTLPLCRGAR